ncbi:MAG: hypothetical protein SPI12_05490 [Actinomycetaceae bacterium]|nr:hypothetical protein [Actinomycetaceae bacterium]MDY6083294.1 hypothetical protein [Actinomycetaceae bacterium]
MFGLFVLWIVGRLAHGDFGSVFEDRGRVAVRSDVDLLAEGVEGGGVEVFAAGEVE